MISQLRRAACLPSQFIPELASRPPSLPFDMLSMMSPVAFSPAAPAVRSVTAPLASAPSMGFGKAELAGAHGQLTSARQSSAA